MKNKRTLVVVALIVAAVLLGIGYAAIANVTLNITGNVTASPDQSNFNVLFDAASTFTVSDANKVTAGRTSNTEATITVTGLSAKDDSVTATYKIKNDSPDLTASITATPQVVSGDTGYFQVTTDWGATAKTIAAGGSDYITVTVTCTQTPIDGDKTANIKVSLTAEPVQP